MSAVTATTSIESRLAAAGLPPLPRLAWLEIDIDALVANTRAISSLLEPGVRLAAVMKADGYGHGLEVVARTMAHAGIDRLCVATFDEAVAIQELGLPARVIVLFKVPAECLPDAAARGIEIVVPDRAAADDLRAMERAPDVPLRFHLEIETGLARAGVPPEEAGAVATRLGSVPGTQLVGLWTHLACSDDREVSAHQVDRFRVAEASLAAAGWRDVPRHLAATGALFGATGPQYEMVRVGLSLYGVLPAGFPVAERARGAAASLRPVMSLKARPIRIEHIASDTPVGYGGTWRSGRPSVVASLPVGYGDGWAFGSAGVTHALVRGRRVPLVGRVAMDVVAADITDVPGVDLSDEFVLLGEQGRDVITAQDLARQRNTIPWEVLTAMAWRLPRVYHSAAGLLGRRTLAGECLTGEERETVGRV